MNSINICIPTLSRYDLLDELIESLRSSIVLPTDIWVIDNGLGYFCKDSDIGVLNFTDKIGIHHHYRKFGYNLGCAASWNWFIQNVEEVRIICNDDICFEPNALGAMVDAYDENALISPDSIIGSNSYSCFLIPDKIVSEVGLFDETISPNYAFYEDNDHFRRLTLAGYGIKAAPNCVVRHGLSSTLKSYSPAQMSEHHRKFKRAQQAYQKKWGGMPGREIFTVPYGGVE